MWNQSVFKLLAEHKKLIRDNEKDDDKVKIIKILPNF